MTRIFMLSKEYCILSTTKKIEITKMKNNKKFWKLNTNSLKEIKAKQKK